MQLSARFLTDVAGVNGWQVQPQLLLAEGDVLTVYLQLIDASKDRSTQGFVPAGRRFVPATGATLSVALNNIDSSKVYTKTASRSFAGLDESIWQFNLLATDAIKGTVSITLTLNEGGKITKGLVQAAILVQPLVGIC